MRNVKYKPKSDSGKHYCENNGIRTRTIVDGHIKPRSKKKTRIRCYKCHEYGHKISECPKYVKHDDINTGLNHDEFLEKFYETLDDQTIFELERKKFEAYPRTHFTKMVKWFYEEYFQQNTKEYPPTLPNGEPIDLFDLYMTVEGLGGRRVVAKEGKWSEVGKELGLVESGPNLRIIYDGYLELLDWMYSNEKEKESKIGETTSEEKKAKGDGPRGKEESEEIKTSPKNGNDAPASSFQNEEKQYEDGEIPDNELYLQEMLDASFDDDFELELLEYTEKNKEDVAVNEDQIQGLGENVGP
ncbi:hypothetical protein E3N88_31078 [Mikania micrantha]|uniref:ARID domain-containing protein n=1 Tax=Mikania micrantha TaxID=192012 RepID=A0A5N6MRC6_9ASTR|nr:hypothetical protein E3N88_31078 [Mikania micrantha]